MEVHNHRQQKVQIQQRQTHIKCFNKETIINKEN